MRFGCLLAPAPNGYEGNEVLAPNRFGGIEGLALNKFEENEGLIEDKPEITLTLLSQ